MSTLKLLVYLAQVSMEQGAIQPRQYEQISLQTYNVQNLLGAWINSDHRRFQEGRKPEKKEEIPEKE